ncbi:MAG TPA: hypothetical protein VHG08_00905 [Longimicrobium sp.]|nr:hypothetical protein [Longimicrobium sp.]
MKKLSMKLDELQVESFETGREKVHGREGGVKAYYGPAHTETTCMQIICDCSAFPSDCDYTCPGYWNAQNASCRNC